MKIWMQIKSDFQSITASLLILWFIFDSKVLHIFGESFCNMLPYNWISYSEILNVGKDEMVFNFLTSYVSCVSDQIRSIILQLVLKSVEEHMLSIILWNDNNYIIEFLGFSLCYWRYFSLPSCFLNLFVWKWR